MKYNKQACIAYAERNDNAIPKYSELAASTGIHRDSQISLFPMSTNMFLQAFASFKIDMAYPTLAAIVHKFALERKWENKYTFRSVMIAMYAELGEIAAAIEWKDEGQNIAQDTNLLDRIAREIADVAIYLIHFNRIAQISNPFED